MSLCLNPSSDITTLSTVDETVPPVIPFTMRYRLQSDPDIDGSYTTVTTTRTVFGVALPFFDIPAVDPGTYVLHTYLTTDGPSTGEKITVIVNCNDPV